jgi:hypothetical protein
MLFQVLHNLASPRKELISLLWQWEGSHLDYMRDRRY